MHDINHTEVLQKGLHLAHLETKLRASNAQRCFRQE